MTISPSLDEFLRNAHPGVHYPIVAERPLGDSTPVKIYAHIRSNDPGVILESGKGGRYSYIASGCTSIWKSHGRECEIAGAIEMNREADPFELLREVMLQQRVILNPRLSNFSGGLIGYFSYDMARHIENLPTLAMDDLGIPESCFLFVDRFYEIDHQEGTLRIVCLPLLNDEEPETQYQRALEVLDQMQTLLESEVTVREHSSSASDESTLHTNFTPDGFASIVQRAKEYIYEGDIFQVNLSVRFHRDLEADPFELYSVLREVNPSPYMSYFDLPECSIVSASPELLIRVDDRMIQTRPIAGTRPRGGSDEEDRANALELIENEKERAEHLMLVDLERNDIGRVARYGSVDVSEFMGIEKYSHVIHIVSNVRGELAHGKDAFDAIRATFPGGTITGAPKVRAMEIIEELEPCRRGLYTGSIGWIGYDGDAELNIAIRTIVVKDGIAYAQAGAGIVADSVPELEYLESLRKAEAALESMRRVSY